MPKTPGIARSCLRTLRPKKKAATGIHTMNGVDGWMREKRSRKSFSNIRHVSLARWTLVVIPAGPNLERTPRARNKLEPANSWPRKPLRGEGFARVQVVA